MILSGKFSSNSQAITSTMPTEYIQKVMDENNWDEKTATIETMIDMLWLVIPRSQIPILGDDGIPITTKELCRKQVIRDINQQDNSTL
jgi:hypothetical protein